MRQLQDDAGLVKGLLQLTNSLLSRSRKPMDALPHIKELSFVAHSANLAEQEAYADQLYETWRLKMEDTLDHFGKAQTLASTFLSQWVCRWQPISSRPNRV